ncbi:MAG: PAS domain-containing protein [Betaproteobacteria bacterium]|nr:PAS domain-containing protein [Betaproteobacteria bacterium]
MMPTDGEAPFLPVSQPFFYGSPVPSACMSASGIVLAANCTALQYLGVIPAGVPGMPLTRFVRQESARDIRRHLLRVSDDVSEIETVFLRSDGEPLLTLIQSTRLQIDTDGPPHVPSALLHLRRDRELTESLRARHERLDFLAHHHPLTGLPSRTLMLDRLEHQRPKHAYGLVRRTRVHGRERLQAGQRPVRTHGRRRGSRRGGQATPGGRAGARHGGPHRR